MQRSVFLTGALCVALAASRADAHGYISQPKATYVANTVYTTYNAIITADNYTAFAGKEFSQTPVENTAVFTAAFAASDFSSLKEMLDPAAPDCGYARTDVDPIDVTSYTTMNWQNNEYQEGFIDSHHGPCEVWINDTRVFQDDDCAADYTSYPAELPIDYSVCAGDCLLTFYWLALHSPSWQIYKQCVPTVYTGSSSTTTTTTTSASESTAADTTTASASVSGEATDSASLATSSAASESTAESSAADETTYSTTSSASTASASEETYSTTSSAASDATEETTAPATTTATPTATTATPTATTATPTTTSASSSSAGSSKCNVRRRLTVTN